MRCCDPAGYADTFDEAAARRQARRYARSGLDKTARRLVDLLVRRGVGGHTILEVGGGIGDIQIELLRVGAAHAVNVELSPSYEDAAHELLSTSGFAGRVERRLGDLVTDAAVPEADTVVLHRVVCCYPDAPALLAAASRRTRQRLAMTIPRDTWWMRLGIRVGNLFFVLRRSSFRAYAHPHTIVLRTLSSLGLRVVDDSMGLIWRILVLERGPA